MNYTFDKKNLITFFMISFFFVIAIFIKCKYFLNGRIWAEEGFLLAEFFNKDVNFIDAIFYIFHGHIEITSNFIVYLAKIATLKYSPIVLMYVSFIIQSIPIVLIICYRHIFKLNFISTLIFLIISLGVFTEEVWANSTCLHFHFGLLVCVLSYLVLNNVFKNNILSNLLLSIIFIISGLSSISACFILPFLLILYFKTKQKSLIYLCVSLFVCSCIQLFLIKIYGGVGTRFDPNLVDNLNLYIRVYIYNVFLRPISMSYSSYFANDFHQLGNYFIPFLITILFIYLLIKMNFPKVKLNSNDNVLLWFSLIMGFLSILFSLGEDKSDYFLGGGSRYFYVPALLLYLQFLGGCYNNENIRMNERFYSYFKSNLVKLFYIVIIISCFHGLVIKGLHVSTSWSELYSEYINSNDSVLKIWPNGWEVVIEKDKVN